MEKKNIENSEITKEQLMEVWEKTKEKVLQNTVLLPEVEKYILQGGETPAFNVGAQIYGIDQPKLLVAALDAPQAEIAGMAARMLRVLSEIRRAATLSIDAYGDAAENVIDLRAGALSGRTFAATLELLVHSRKDDAALENYYTIGKALAKSYPEEAGIFADSTGHQAKAPEDDWPEMMRCTLRVMCSIALAESDEKLCSKYAPMISHALDELPKKHADVVLAHAWMLSPELKSRAVNDVKTSYDTLYTIARGREHDREESAKILTGMGIPQYRHLLVARDIRYNAKVADYFTDLYKTKPEDVHWTCQKLLGEKENGRSYSAGVPIAALLCHNNDGEAELPLAEQALPKLLKKFDLVITLKDSSSAYKEVVDYLDGKLQYEQMLEMVNGKKNYSRSFYEALGAICTFSPRMEKLIRLCISIGLAQNLESALLDIYDNLLISQMEWCGKTEEETLKIALSFGFSHEVVYYDYAYGEVNSGRNFDTEKLVLQLLKEKPEDAVSFLNNKWILEPAYKVCWMKLIYEKFDEKNCEPLCELLNSKSKKVRDTSIELLASREEQAREYLEKIFSKFKSDSLKLAKKLIRNWDNERKYGKGFVITSSTMAADFAKENLDAANLNLISWIPEEMLKNVKFADSQTAAPLECMQFILVDYMGLAAAGRLKLCDQVASQLVPRDLEQTMADVLQLWMNDGADTKKKNILLPYCIYASDTQILGMRKQLENWAAASRGALAAFAAQAVALNGGSVALLMIDGISTKFPNNQVKNAAKKAFSLAAAELGVPEDALSDRIVPTLGFSKAGKKEFDYGSRKFTVTLMPDFSLSIYDEEKGKTVKSMPKPGASDDEQKAEAARKEFSELKKQMKAVVQTQTQRLEKVLQNGRAWSSEAWQTLFAENPIMHCFATGLIWGSYQDGALTATFRYLDDGSFTSADEEEVELLPDMQISLVHPCEMETEEIAAWKQQLEDYEIVQPLQQLDLPVVSLAGNDVRNGVLVRYDGKESTVSKISSTSKKIGMLRGDILDGGSYTCFHWLDTYLNIGVQINFEYMYMGQDYSEAVPLQEVVFYTLSEDGLFDEVPDKLRIDPLTVPKRFMSSVLAVFDSLV